jgi:hypothetical protein
MKKIHILLFSLVCSFGFSQMTLKKLDGTTINNGDIFTFDVATDPASDFGFVIGNSSSSSITVKTKCTSMTNTNGNNVVYCVQPNCISNLVVGNPFPSAGAIIPAGGTNGNFDHFENLDTGINSSLNVEYVFKFYQVDHSGNEIGTPISFTYRYTPALSDANFESIKNIGVILQTNLIQSTIELVIANKTEMKLYSVSGQLIKNEVLVIGNQRVDVSDLTSGIYILHFKNEQGLEASIKIMKK